ncbi:serine acetyltransferase [Azonexus hydrophilus]|uniref:Serine acetyltransferase n=1 Tax=Azonexus hydrophilus TaxID=418702 RepID=A0A1R1I8Y8_9RHOO|nr:serine acetyltransferase [Azonexus hydrophilus]OMG55127.1 serine acetyltransferase [Azonexus hydrophilus]
MFFNDLRNYREGIISQGFWSLQIYRFGQTRNKFRSKIFRYPIAIIHRILSKISEIFFGIYIGAHAKIGQRLIIEHFGGIIIHNNTIIGDDVIIRQGVTIGNKNLDDPTGAPIIGNRVNIGAGAKILGRITIGDDVTIGANAVVLTNVPANHLAVGVPAVLKKLEN